jgi:hypothetical protein
MKVSEYNNIKAAAERARDVFYNNPIGSYRVATKVWKHILLMEKDTIITQGQLRQIVAKNLGAGVYELTLKEKKNEHKL